MMRRRASYRCKLSKDQSLCDERIWAKGKVPLSERLWVSPEEASALTGIGRTSVREAIGSGHLKAKKHGRRTIILPNDLRVWLNALPDATSREAADAQ
jgi:excisionase family DNA binding protein